ncbi:SMP-30/gluconolactonase/LRE family protein [Hyphococcus flavus]|uniref:SMP-30/gluconolactonase/LRE family protein n=1 Tax=Hyphococcus flavus TaxID=1866326 RepID=A0AAE9ZB83_9PROT|nr:SMP-30/gluconolactonase/LRE family protein [Hyphococcus flavus]WDI31419.1 SMP-30/gluconolactonase/LRE family protein [Hyphococcus flavus]
MRIWLFLVGLVVLAGGVVALNLRSFNHFSSIEPAPLASCLPVTGIPGPEDIRVDQRRQQAFISSLDRRAEDARGAIHVFDLSDPLASNGFRDRTMGVPEAFRPLGIDYYEDGETRRLFVVNDAGPSVEVYDVLENGDLEHLDTFSERRLNSPNSVAATSARSFYVTNDVRPGRKARIASLHFLMRTGSGDVYFVDGAIWKHVAEGLRFANGIALGPDGESVYVAETSGKAVQVFRRDPASGSLTPANTINLKSSPDNVSVDSSGKVWVGALPKPLRLPALAKSPSATAPSEVLVIGEDGEPVTVYRNEGDELSASTVAAPADGKLLIGTVYDEKFLLCDLPKTAG